MTKEKPNCIKCQSYDMLYGETIGECTCKEETPLSEKIEEDGYIHSLNVKEAVEKLKEEAFDNRTISAAREEDCVLIETLNLIIKEIFGEFE